MNILIVGLGSIAKKHIMAILQLKSNNIIYAWRSSLNSEPCKNVKNIFHFEDIKERQWGFVIISNPTSMHKATIKQLLELNCPLFIEKPIHHTLEIEALVKNTQDKGILTYVACNLRFLDCLKFIKGKIERENPRINEINVYCGSYLPEWRPGINLKESYSANKNLGGGVHLDLIHELDYLYWIFGIPLKSNVIMKNNSHIDIDSTDYVNYLFEYPGFCTNVVLNYYRRDYKRTFEILTEDKTWLVELNKNRVLCNEEIVFSSESSFMNTYTEQMNYFFNLVKLRKKKSFNTIQDGYSVLKMCLGNNN